MPYFLVDYMYTAPEWSTVTVEADDYDDAEEKAIELIRERDLEIIDIEINSIEEVKKT